MVVLIVLVQRLVWFCRDSIGSHKGVMRDVLLEFIQGVVLGIFSSIKCLPLVDSLKVKSLSRTRDGRVEDFMLWVKA